MALLVVAWIAIALLIRPVTLGSTFTYGAFEVVESNEPGSNARGLVYQHGYEATLLLSIRNQSWLPITVRDIQVFPRPGEVYSLIQQTGMLVETFDQFDNPGFGGVDEGVRLPENSITIEAGSDHEIGVEVRLDDCRWFSEGVSLTFDRMTVSYTILGFPRSAEVATHGLWVTSPPEEDCPG
jgi:hypothetical protein